MSHCCLSFNFDRSQARWASIVALLSIQWRTHQRAFIVSWHPMPARLDTWRWGCSVSRACVRKLPEPFLALLSPSAAIATLAEVTGHSLWKPTHSSNSVAKHASMLLGYSYCIMALVPQNKLKTNYSKFKPRLMDLHTWISMSTHSQYHISSAAATRKKVKKSDSAIHKLSANQPSCNAASQSFPKAAQLQSNGYNTRVLDLNTEETLKCSSYLNSCCAASKVIQKLQSSFSKHLKYDHAAETVNTHMFPQGT